MSGLDDHPTPAAVPTQTSKAFRTEGQQAGFEKHQARKAEDKMRDHERQTYGGALSGKEGLGGMIDAIRRIAHEEAMGALSGFKITGGGAVGAAGAALNWSVFSRAMPEQPTQVAPGVFKFPDLDVYDLDGTTLLHTGADTLVVDVDDSTDPVTTAEMAIYKFEWCSEGVTYLRYGLFSPLEPVDGGGGGSDTTPGA